MTTPCPCCEGWPHAEEAWGTTHGRTLRKVVLNLLEQWMETGWESDMTARRFTTLCQFMQESDPEGYAACIEDARDLRKP